MQRIALGHPLAAEERSDGEAELGHETRAGAVDAVDDDRARAVLDEGDVQTHRNRMPPNSSSTSSTMMSTQAQTGIYVPATIAPVTAARPHFAP